MIQAEEQRWPRSAPAARKVSPTETQAAMHLLEGKKKEAAGVTHRGLSYPSEHRESGLIWTSMPSHSLFNIIIHL